MTVPPRGKPEEGGEGGIRSDSPPLGDKSRLLDASNRLAPGSVPLSSRGPVFSFLISPSYGWDLRPILVFQVIYLADTTSNIFTGEPAPGKPCVDIMFHFTRDMIEIGFP
jgi:hypothetical protein